MLFRLYWFFRQQLHHLVLFFLPLFLYLSLFCNLRKKKLVTYILLFCSTFWCFYVFICFFAVLYVLFLFSFLLCLFLIWTFLFFFLFPVLLSNSLLEYWNMLPLFFHHFQYDQREIRLPKSNYFSSWNR